MVDVLGSIRRKYRSFIPKPREVIDPETGEIISSLDEHGREVLDPTPIAPPIGFKAAPSMADYIRDLIRSEKLAQEAEASGMETFEESEDFDVGDDFEPSTPYEAEFDPEYVEAKSELIRKSKEPEAPIQSNKQTSRGGGQPPHVEDAE